ncbi:hypothetical protein EP10_003517 [Geobacillus icigianus]|uniref:Transposase DDE domain-containing protein n=1 Tax=Geobacillus icigianus TaxID=1430331 RepID=A0ABU6BL50_9BACL|nr:hypothetical protein [Geobacillus icigianus]
MIIAIHIWGKLLGFSSERAWYRFVTGNSFPNGQFLERSRSNRRCRALRFAFKWIRHELAKRGHHHGYAVVDSLLLPLCHAARRHRVKRAQGIADIGYGASKKQWYDGWKLHRQVTDQVSCRSARGKTKGLDGDSPHTGDPNDARWHHR